MATSHRPIKGILKNKGSTTTSGGASAQQFRTSTQAVQRKKSQRWDEYNILATHLSSYRDHDLVKANEPGTPYVGVQDTREVTARDVKAKEVITLDMLAKKLAATDLFETKGSVEDEKSGEAHTNQFLLTKKEKQRQFEMKRKLLYSEGLNLKSAAQLLSEDLWDELDEDEKQESLTKENATTEVPADEDDLKAQLVNA
ncbi:Type-1 protein phosphatase inhibitor 4 [Heterocephalus glaber]|uniref:Type-1 protein phosphatase inhibitor 4 n=1 Tax=Heterocephalus glaber TaxID=10181 RepID=G5AUV2_HETGA|nr:type-1 protein phosphatase inhibitor 4 [Heterocephalus glaber]EHB00813.1 Type-1 protein phosphatase inhibitor 4 [Heterocephalus glaber]